MNLTLKEELEACQRLVSGEKCGKYGVHRQVSEIEVIINRNLVSLYCIVTYSRHSIVYMTGNIHHMR
jgi:hypothetical protein